MDPVTRALMKEYAIENDIEELSSDKIFEHFAAYSIVSSHYKDDFRSEDLVTGGGADLNVDAFAAKVNGRLVSDEEAVDDLLELNGYLEVEFIILQAKTSSKFDGSAIISLGDNLVSEIFSETQNAPASDEIIQFIKIKDKVFSYANRLNENPVCRVYYVCTGNWKNDNYLDTVIERKRNDLLNTNLFSNVIFEPIGARELQQLYRATRTSISKEIRFERLVTLPQISDVKASYMGLLPASEYLKLITDDDGDILKSVFVDNVRDFQGENPVNVDIAKTIQDSLFDQFVLRNNGVTIVARNIKVTANQFTLEDYQIVNGCQTSHVVFAHREKVSDELFLPLKLIHTESEEVAQAIIKSTNKQTEVKDNDLLSLTQFQRDLEDFFAGVEEDGKLFYERRAKQYASQQNLERGRIVIISSQLKSFSSMFLDAPHQAGRYQGTLLKLVKDRVFQPNHRPEPYYLSAFAFYRFEVLMRRLTAGKRWIRSFRYYLLLAFRYRFEEMDYPGTGNPKIVHYCNKLNDRLQSANDIKESLDECIAILKKAMNNLNLEPDRDNAKSRPLLDEVKRISLSRNPVNKKNSSH